MITLLRRSKNGSERNSINSSSSKIKSIPTVYLEKKKFEIDHYNVHHIIQFPKYLNLGTRAEAITRIENFYYRYPKKKCIL